jgi:hypothetical protein
MSKIFKTLTTIMLALLLSFTVIACDDNGGDGESAKTTGDFVYELETGTKENAEGEDEEYEYYKITGYTITSEDALKMAQGDFTTVASKRDIEIPNEYNGKPVEEIASMAFADQIILKSVKFKEDTNIKTIGLGAFSGCLNLQSIENLPFIGKKEGAVGEEKVLGHLFGSSSSSDKNTVVTAKVYNESTDATISFNVPTALKTITTTSAIIPECAFYGFTMLENVTISNATEIGASAFSGCTAIVSIALPKVEYIYDSAFSNCSALQVVDLAGNEVLKYIGDKAFSACSYFGYNYVSEEESLLTFVVPDTVTYLGEGAFSNCSLLKYVKIGAGVTEIKTGTFENCLELAKVTITSNVTIRNAAFFGCNKDSLKVYVNGAEIELTSVDFGKVEI